MAIDRANFSGTDLDQAMQTVAQTVLDRAPSILSLFSRRLEARARVSDNVILDNYHFDVDGAKASTILPVVRSEKDNYDPTSEFSLSQQSFKIDKGHESGFRVYLNDIMRSTRGRARVADGSEYMRNEAALARENDLIAYLAALSAYTTPEPAAGDLPKLDNTGDNGNAGKIFEVTVGAAANTLSSVDGEINGNDTAKKATARALVDGLSRLRLRMERRYLAGNSRMIGAGPGMMSLLLPPEVARAYVDAMEILDIRNDEAQAQALRDMGAFQSEALRGVLKDIGFYSRTALPVPASAGAGYTGYLIGMNAVEYAENYVRFWSTAPKELGGVNDGPYYEYKQRAEWGRKLVNPEFIMRVKFRSAAPA